MSLLCLQAVLEATWPSDMTNSSQLMWNKLRNVIVGAALFKKAGKKSARRRLSSNVDFLTADKTECTPAPPPSRPLFTVPAWCPMNHRLKRRVRQHSPKSFFTSLDWYKRDLTTTCRKLEGNWRKAKKDGEGRITLYLVFTHCSFSRSKHHAPTSQITPPFYIPFSFYILPLCYFTFFYFLSPFWSLFISIPILHLLFLFI